MNPLAAARYMVDTRIDGILILQNNQSNGAVHKAALITNEDLVRVCVSNNFNRLPADHFQVVPEKKVPKWLLRNGSYIRDQKGEVSVRGYQAEVTEVERALVMELGPYNEPSPLLVIFVDDMNVALNS